MGTLQTTRVLATTRSKGSWSCSPERCRPSDLHLLGGCVSESLRIHLQAKWESSDTELPCSSLALCLTGCVISGPCLDSLSARLRVYKMELRQGSLGHGFSHVQLQSSQSSKEQLHVRAQSCLTLCDSMDGSPPDPLSMGFPRQGYWSVLAFPSPGDLSNPGIKPESLMSPAWAGGFFTASVTWGTQKAGAGGMYQSPLLCRRHP